MKITFKDIKKLKAALICAGKQDVREYLNGVHVEIQEKQILLVSTDAKRLSVIREQSDEIPKEAVGLTFIIPRYLAEQACKAANSSCDFFIEFYYNDDTAQNQLDYSVTIGNNLGFSISGRSIDAKFPEWRRFIPSGDIQDIKLPSFNSEYAADFAKISKLLNPKNKAPVMRFIETAAREGVYLVDINCEDFIGTLAGIREKSGLDVVLPQWLGLPELVRQEDLK